jgi:hypothetical protein
MAFSSLRVGFWSALVREERALPRTLRLVVLLSSDVHCGFFGSASSRVTAPDATFGVE